MASVISARITARISVREEEARGEEEEEKEEEEEEEEEGEEAGADAGGRKGAGYAGTDQPPSARHSESSKRQSTGRATVPSDRRLTGSR